MLPIFWINQYNWKYLCSWSSSCSADPRVSKSRKLVLGANLELCPDAASAFWFFCCQSVRGDASWMYAVKAAGLDDVHFSGKRTVLLPREKKCECIYCGGGWRARLTHFYARIAIGDTVSSMPEWSCPKDYTVQLQFQLLDGKVEGNKTCQMNKQPEIHIICTSN